jgi:hypothetical protein
MGILDSMLQTEERQKCLYLKADFVGEILDLPIRRKMIVREKGDEVVQGWPFDPRLRIRLKLKGRDYGMVYPISDRNAIIDPLGITEDELKGKKLWSWMQGIAAEEFHYARDKKLKDVSEKATYPLAIGAAILVVIIGLTAAYGFYVK